VIHTVKEIYEQSIQVVEDFYKKVGAGENPNPSPVFLQADQLLRAVETSGASLLELTRQAYENNLYRHVVNVTIVSLTLGCALKLKADKLSVLAKAGLLFDLGMMKIQGGDMSHIRQHPETSAKILEGLPDIPPDAIQVALQHHERRDGSGYPKGLKAEETHPMARIVALADTFCNLTHVAPGQRILSLNESMRELLKGKSLFDDKCLRALLENVTFYPKGTWVKLSTGDTGKVVAENLGMPLRPIIKIYCDQDDERIYSEQFVDLKSATGIFINQVLLEEKLKQKGIDLSWS